MRRVKVILQQNFPSLGFIGDEVVVRGGYARNFLLPRGVAFEASSANEKLLKHRLSAVAAKRIKLRGEAERVVKEMEGMVPEFSLRIGEGGKSFGAVSNRDITKWLTDKGYSIDRSQVIIPEPIKKAGEHQVKIRLHSEVIAQLKVRVNAEAPAPAAREADAGAKPARRGGKRNRKSDEAVTTDEAGQSPEEGSA